MSSLKRKTINLALLLDQPKRKSNNNNIYNNTNTNNNNNNGNGNGGENNNGNKASLQTSGGSSSTAVSNNKPFKAPINLALLLDKPRTKPAAVPSPVAEPVVEAAADFTPQGCAVLGRLPTRFDSEQEVHRWCDIPKCLADVRPDTLLKRNGGQMFPGITFLEKPHEYWLAEAVYLRLCDAQNKPQAASTTGGGKAWNFHRFSGSVTKVAGRCFSPFDKDKAISAVLGSRNYNNPDYDYYEMSGEQIGNAWLAANLLGTLLHFLIELDFNEMTHLIPECLKEITWRQYLQFKSQFMRNTYLPYLTELRVYDLEYDLAGSIDAVVVRRAELEAALREKRLPKIVLIDWKRTSSLSQKSFTGETAAPPLQMFQDCTFFKYSMQLNIYRRLIEKNTAYRVEAMYLCRFHPNLGEDAYDLQPIENYPQQVDDILALRKAEMQIAQHNT